MAEVSLRPMSLRPGGGAGANPFAKFGKGAAPTKAAKAPAVDAENLVKKPPGEVVRYDREFLTRFSQKFADLPPGLEPNSSEAIINRDDPTQQAAREALQNALPTQDEVDDRNWRTRAPPPPSADGSPAERELIRGPAPANGAPANGPSGPQRPSSAGPQGSRQQDGPTSGAPARNDSTSQLQSASAVGKKAWMPGTTSAEGDAAALKSVKGILNKLTPEKFDRLLGQLVAAVTSVDVLNGLIKLVFENAVEQPTFVAMYAELCEALAQQLPELAPPKGESKPMSFQRLLLNHCQDSFEGTLEQRQALKGLVGSERDVAERQLKKRTIGNIRLIAELYKRSVVREPVMHVCISELLGSPAQKPTEDNIEALCEMMTVAGKKLEETSKSPARVQGYLNAMEKLSKSDGIAPRIKFLIRDVLDLRRMKWVPRRETLKAKKLEEIHAEAHAELGMMPALAMASLPPLPGLAQLGPARPAAAEEVDLFPAFKGAEDGDWQKFLGGSGDGGSKSALLGDFTPLTQPAAQPAGADTAASNATPPQTSAAPQYIKGLTEEERERRADGLFTEFLSSNDEKEAVLCAHELAAPGFLPTLVQRGVLKLLDLMKPRDQEVVSDLLTRLPSKGAYSAEDLQAGLGKVTEQLDDLMMDAPLAPKLCAGVLGRALLQGVLPPDTILDICKPIEGGEVRRALIAPALQYVKAEGGEDKLKELVGGLKGSDFLEADPELDPPDLPSVSDFLAAEGLTALAA